MGEENSEKPTRARKGFSVNSRKGQISAKLSFRGFISTIEDSLEENPEMSLQEFAEKIERLQKNSQNRH